MVRGLANKLAGFDVGATAPTFEPARPGTVLVMDGDAAAYKAAATVKKLETAIGRFHTQVLTAMFETRCAAARVHLTSSECIKDHRFLYPTERPYQGNRKSKDKPPLLEPLREALAVHEDHPPGIEVLLQRHYEADDTMRFDAEVLGDNCVVYSEDKDLRQLTQPYYEQATGQLDKLTDPFGWVGSKTTPAGALKLTGHGHAFVLTQWLAGDTADNVRGLRAYDGQNCGPVKALALVQGWGDALTCVHETLKAYAQIQQDPLAELEMLWLRRFPGDSAYRWLTELDLKPRWRGWVDSLHERHVKLLHRAGISPATSQDQNNA